VDWLDRTALGPSVFGVGLAALLTLLTFAALPTGERRLARGPLLLLVLHGLASWVEARTEPATTDARVWSFISTFALFGSMARSAFLLAVQSLLARRLTRPWPRILRDVLQGFLYFAVALLSLRAAGVEPGSLLATSALLTAVIGLSLQETLGNLFAGLSLQAQPPFSVGDWLQFGEGPDGIGRVTEINWRATRLVTISEIELIVPNGVIAKAPLRNYSRPTTLMRHQTTLILPDSVPPQRVQDVVIGALSNLPGVLATPPPSVLTGAFVERGITYVVRYYVDDFASIEPIDGELRKRLWYGLRRESIELPLPRSRVESVPHGGSASSLSAAAQAAVAPALTQRLGAVDFLAGVSPEVLEHLARGTSSALYGPGELIVVEGESGSDLFVIERGRVQVFVTREGSPRTLIAALGPGHFFGEAALLRDEQRTATVVAETECALLVISSAAFRAASQIDPSIAERVTSKLAARLNELAKAMSESSDGDEERRSVQLLERVKRFFQA
jgi:small-conductance mechanosensitive channel/CRP-like cAMP-binding protein